MTHAGVGMQSNMFGVGSGYGFSALRVIARACRGNVVTDVTSRAYSLYNAEAVLEFRLSSRPAAIFRICRQRGHFTSANNATALYLNYSRPVVLGFRATGAKIGIHVQNTTTEPHSSTCNYQLDVGRPRHRRGQARTGSWPTTRAIPIRSASRPLRGPRSPVTPRGSVSIKPWLSRPRIWPCWITPRSLAMQST